MSIKNLVNKNKRALICLTISLVVGIIGGMGNMPKEEYNQLLSQKEELQTKVADLANKVEVAKNQADVLQDQKNEKERIAKEEAEKLAKAEEEKKAKEEAEKLAKAEAEKKAKEEAERLAKIEAENRAQEEENNRLAQQQTNYNNTSNGSYSGGSGNLGGSGNSGGSESSNQSNIVVDTSAPIGEMVWLSATGTKYHRINNCGRMNPANARQVTIGEAQSKGFGACDKCF